MNWFLCLSLAACVGLAPLAAQELSLSKQVIERVLPNGLKVLMVKRADMPTVRCLLAYRVGSVNERPGITGISHFHEHMMFKGTFTMGIKPGTLEKDTEYNRQIDALEAQIVAEEGKIKGRDESKIMALKKQASDLLTKEKAETIVSEEIWSAYQEAGGTGLNASTGKEMTQYYVTLPKNKIELYMALEADRMANPVFREFYSERDVIVEERRMSENQPGFFFSEQLNAAFYAASPYSWEVLGWMSDVSRVTKQEMMDYRNLYYRPDNAVLVLAGDIDVEPTMALVAKYFGPISSQGPSPRVRTEEPTPEYFKKVNGAGFKAPYIEKRVLGRAAANPSVQILFHVPPLWHDDLAPLSVLSQVMSARTGKMYLDLVQKNEHATSVSARAFNSEYDGQFSVTATAKEVRNQTVVPLDQIEKELWNYIEDTKTTPVDDVLLQRVKNSIEARFLQSLAGTVSANALSLNIKYLDEGLKIWMDILTNPAFPEDKLRREKDAALPGIRNRNKNVTQVASRVYEQLIYGEDSPIAQDPTEATITAIGREDLLAWHKKYWGTNNAVLVVSGDFKKAEMLKKLEAGFGKWRKAEKAVPAVPRVQQAAKAGVYMVKPEVVPNQGVIRIGHLGLRSDDPDYPAVDLMNYVLGGGSFSSRITKVVRTDNGLAYSTSSSFSGGGGGGGPRGGRGGGSGAGILYPGMFTASCQTKNSTVVFASQLMLDLIEDMRSGNVGEADLKMAKSARVNAFPSMFSGVGSIIQNFANLEFNGRPMDYYEAYLARYEKVTVADLKRVAQKWLQPDKMIIMVAGNIEECRAGADKMLPNQATIDAMAAKFGGRTIDGLAKKYGDGTVHIITLK